jgi:DNA-binding MarR family transcriptional regulator
MPGDARPGHADPPEAGRRQAGAGRQHAWGGGHAGGGHAGAELAEPQRSGTEQAGPQWLSNDEQRAWRSFLEACQALFTAVEGQLQHDAGLPHGYYEILVRLSESPGRAMRMTQLADASTSSKSRLSHAVARLEERGWVRRANCPTDRRGQVAELTDEGFAALAAAAPGHVAQVRRSLISQLSPEQVEQLRAISEAIVAGADPAAKGGSCPPCGC